MAEHATHEATRRGRSSTGPARGARRENGQATLELVLVLPIVMLVLLAVVQVTLLGVQRMTVLDAAREGAREAAVTGDHGQITAAVRRVASDGGGDVEVAISGERSEGGTVKVTVTKAVRPAVPIVGGLFPDVVHMRGAVSMRVEEP